MNARGFSEARGTSGNRIDMDVTLRLFLAIVGLGTLLVILAAVRFWFIGPGSGAMIVMAVGGILLVFSGLGLVWIQLGRHFARIERLRNMVLLLGDQGIP